MKIKTEEELEKYLSEFISKCNLLRSKFINKEITKEEALNLIEELKEEYKNK